MYRFCEERFAKTTLNSNSQKVECVNRVLRRSVPTNVTYPRNFVGRSHSAVHSVNNGPKNDNYVGHGRLRSDTRL